MSGKWTLFLAAVVASIAAAAGCHTPVQRTLTQAQVRLLDLPPRAVNISVEVLDARPAQELVELKPPTTYLVPLFPLLWIQGHEGNAIPASHLYSLNPAAELAQMVQSALHSSGLSTAFDADTAALLLRVTLRNLYGTTHASGMFFASPGAVGVRERTFGPYGYAAAEVERFDATGRSLGFRVVRGVATPRALEALGQAEEMKFRTDQLTAAAVQAAGELVHNIVQAVEPMIAEYAAKPGIDVNATEVFFIARATAAGDAIETVGIHIASGEIVSVNVIEHWMEPYVGPGEWIVDPYHGGNVRLSRNQYQALIARLSEIYDVRYVRDVRAAHFFGKRRRPGAPEALSSNRSLEHKQDNGTDI